MKKTNLVFLILAIIFTIASFLLVSIAYNVNFQSQTIDSGLGFVFTSNTYQVSPLAELLNTLGRMSFALGIVLFVSFAIMNISTTSNNYYAVEEIIDDECGCSDEGCTDDCCSHPHQEIIVEK